MLGGGKHRVDRLQILALEPAHPRRGHQLAQQHILARAFHAASPALVAGDVDHRREVPVDARRRGLVSGHPGGALGKVRIEARSLAHRHRKDRAMAVDDVGAEDQRDLEP